MTVRVILAAYDRLFIPLLIESAVLVIHLLVRRVDKYHLRGFNNLFPMTGFLCAFMVHEVSMDVCSFQFFDDAANQTPMLIVNQHPLPYFG